MFKIEYTLMVQGESYEFEVSNESLTVLKRNTVKDILDFARGKQLPTGSCDVEMVVTYNDEYYDMDVCEMEISADYGKVEMVA